MKSKWTFLLVFFVLFSFYLPYSLLAQDVEKIVVDGVVMDEDNETVPFINVKITPTSGDSTQYYTQVTDHLGCFRIALPTAGEYRIDINMMSMGEYSKVFTIPKDVKKYSLGNLVLENSSTLLESVTIKSTKKLVKIEADKISYDIKEDPESKSSNLLKMLRKVPLVTVDGRGNIQVNGSSNFKIFRNGKEDKMLSSNPKEILKSIPATSIKSIEVITDGGVRFDAESSNAILNIVTDRASSLSGVAGTVGVDVGSYGNYSGNLYLDAKVGKVGFSGNAIYGLFGEKPSLAESTTNLGAINITSEGESRYKGHFSMFNGTISYEIDSLNLLSLSARGMPYTSKSKNNQIDQKWNGDTLIEKVNNNSSSIRKNGNFSINLDYQHSTLTPGELFTISYMFDRSPNNSENSVIRNVLDLNTGDVLSDGFMEQLSQTTAAMNEHTAQIDYTRPFQWKMRHNLEAGVKYIARRSLSTPEYLIRNNPDEDFRIGSIFGQHINNSELNYGQDIYAAYFGWSTFWTKKFSTKIGTRLEQSRLDVKYTDLPDANFIRKKLDFVPQVRLSYKITPYDQTSLNYNFLIRRPGIHQVNPYRSQSSEYRVSFGNPDLEAERNHKLGLTYGHFSSKFTVNTNLNFNFSNNTILQYSEESATSPGVIQETYSNLGKSRGLSFNVYVNYAPWTWLRLYMNGWLSNNRLRSDVLESDQKWSTIIAFMGSNFILPKNWNLGINCGGYKFNSFQTSSDFFYYSHFSVSKSFLDDRLSLSFSIAEPFRSTISMKSHSYGKGFETHSINTNTGARTMNFSVSYRFGELKERIKSVSRTISNSDLMEGDNKGGSGKSPM